MRIRNFDGIQNLGTEFRKDRRSDELGTEFGIQELYSRCK
jgi:hypothetical protein